MKPSPRQPGTKLNATGWSGVGEGVKVMVASKVFLAKAVKKGTDYHKKLDKLPPGKVCKFPPFAEHWSKLLKFEEEKNMAKVKEKVTTYKRYGEKTISVGIYVATLWANSSNVKYPYFTCEITFGTYAILGIDSTCAKKAVQNAVKVLQKYKGLKEEELEIKG